MTSNNERDNPGSSAIQRSQRNITHNSESDDEVLEETEAKYKTKHIIQLFVPVSLCMAIVVTTISTVEYFSRDDGVYLIYTPFSEHTDNATDKLISSVGNALVFLCVVVVMTSIAVALYKFRCYKAMHGWLILSTVMILFAVTGLYVGQILASFNVPVDYITLVFCLWNFSVLGILCIHWKGPQLLQQAYLVLISAMMALLFIKHLPDWSVWTILGIVSVWDLVAVLCPFGPLRILVELSQKRNEPIMPALIYSATVVYPYILFGAIDDNQAQDSDAPLVPSTTSSISSSAAVDITPASTTTIAPPIRIAPARKQRRLRANPSDSNEGVTNEEVPSSENRRPPARVRQPAPNNVTQVEVVEVIEDEGIKLGLGDFIFYSILVGKACSYGDWYATIACYVAILIGLAFTLMLLAVYRKALPALPISIFAGLICYFFTREFVTPFMELITMRQIVP